MKLPKCGAPMVIAMVSNFQQYQCSTNSLFNPEYCWIRTQSF